MNNLKLLPWLLTFAEVARHKSFTLAARQLGLSKSAVSQQIKRLEQHVGQQLLSRHTRGMSLTGIGEKLLARCELLQAQVDLALEELNSSKEAPSGIFALTIPHSCERDIVIPALNQLCVEFPKIEPKILVTDQAKDLIKDKLDVAIYGGKLKDSNYRALPIGSMREVFCAAPGYISQQGLPASPQDAPLHRWISPPWQGRNITFYPNHDLSNGVSMPITAFAHTNTLPSALEMALQNMGIALLPEVVLQAHIREGRLLRVLPAYQGSQWDFYLVHRFQGEKPLHITRFYQLVRHFFAKAHLGID
ncbi:LysR family transcriptional regulator [Thalassomonas viridans]|uniref:LysR family transcriptional regulator n=1 Tax=Thalassomonas viridans TaxID=137584 RepID=A0AAF0CBE9_9GAMM|nr:LysR family transcriptional regulator [Thalassomonas viridans]WDE07125.1 LysR family transcriptional regulator [Thalassomonas viridans]